MTRQGAKNAVAVVPTQNGKSTFGALIQGISSLAPGEKELLRATVAKGANDNELAWFLYLCKQYDLDPFMKQVWFIKYKEGIPPTMQVGRDGYLAIAQRHPQFAGLKGATVYEGDEFEMDTNELTVKHKIRGKRGSIVGAWAMALRKDKDPVLWFAPIEEYDQDRDIWRKYKSAMILKVAESYVLKKQFEIYGLDSEDAIGGPEYVEAEIVDIPNSRPETPPVDDKTHRLQRMQGLLERAVENGFTTEEFQHIRQSITSSKLPPMDVIDQLENALDAAMAERTTAVGEAPPTEGLGLDDAEV